MTSLRVPNVSLDPSANAAACEPEQEALISLVRSYEGLWSEQNKFFQRFDITPQQFNVLKILASQGDKGHGVACQAIGEQLLNRVPDITRLLDRLEQAGLIWRERCCSDRRVVRTHLTDAGRAKVEEVGRPLREALKARFGHMSVDEVRELARLLTKLREPLCPLARAAFAQQQPAPTEGRDS